MENQIKEEVIDKDFASIEHEGGQHKFAEFPKECYACWKESGGINSPIDSLSAITGVKLSDLLGK